MTEYKTAFVESKSTRDMAYDIECKLNGMSKQGYELVSCSTENVRCILIFKKM